MHPGGNPVFLRLKYYLLTIIGLAILKQRISCLLPNVAPHIDGFTHDMCDAAIAAYTAYRHYQGKTEFCGEPDEGTICLPFLDRTANAD